MTAGMPGSPRCSKAMSWRIRCGNGARNGARLQRRWCPMTRPRAPVPRRLICRSGMTITRLAPSRARRGRLLRLTAGEDQGAEPPRSRPRPPRHAARRGSLIHKLLERLPDVAEAERTEAARRWLERQAGDLDSALREEMVAAALGVLGHPDFGPLFSSAGAGRGCRWPRRSMAWSWPAPPIGCLIEEGRITVVDFKTTRRPPAKASGIPAGTLRQMAAYVAALEVIYPGREVRAGVLYTHAPALFELVPEALRHHKIALQGPQQSLLPPDIE